MNKKYAFTDVHGMYDLWAQIRDYCDETDTIYFLGDACDRGPDGLKIIMELLKDKRVKYIQGNHEDFFVRCGSEIVESMYRGNLNIWHQNGGTKTINDFENLHQLTQEYLIRKINSLPVYLEIENVKGQKLFLSHAGITPNEEHYYRYQNLIWDRDHIYDEWSEEEKYANMYIIHGHTPVPHLAYKINEQIKVDNHGIWEPLTYANGHKICLDVASFSTNKICLFDLDEMKIAKTFYCRKEKEKCLIQSESKKE